MAWRFEPGEGLRKAFRRVSAEEIAKVRAGLDGTGGGSRQGDSRGAPGVQAAARAGAPRQAAARLRFCRREPPLAGRRAAALRLARHDRASAELRQARGRSRSRHPGRGGRSACDRGSRLTEPRTAANDIEEKLRQVLALLDDAEASVAELDWPNSKRALLRGFHRGQKRLRRDWKAACEDARARRAAQLAKAREGSVGAAPPVPARRAPGVPRADRRREGDRRAARQRARSLAPLRAASRRSDALRSRGHPRPSPRRDREAARARCGSEAFKKGEDFSSQKAKAFAGVIGTAWDKASKRKARKSGKRRRANGADPAAISPPR